MEIFVDKKSGRIDAPFFTLLAVETVKLPDTVPDGMTVAILTPAGETLAMGHASGGSVVLDSNTLQAAGYFGDAPVGTSKNAFIVIGETDSLLAIIPVLVRANPLDMLAPPSAMAQAYPTTAELNKILAQVQAAAREATEAAQNVAEETVEALRAELEKTLGQFNAVAGQIESNKAVIVDYVDKKLPAAANKIAQDIDAAATAASTALDNKVSTASTALDNKVSTASTALDGKVTAANNAATAADGSAKAAKKARDDAETFKGNAAESAKNAATSAEQAESAKTAIGDVGGRLDAVETSVAERAPRISKYLRGMFDYTLVETKEPSADFYHSCHDGWVVYNRYANYERFHISSTGLVTEIVKNVSSAYATKLFIVIDTINSVTKFFENQSGTYYLTTISGVGDNVAISRVKIDTLPNEAIASYSFVYGLVLKNGFVVCNKGQILDANLNEMGTFNCSATSFPMTQMVRTADNTVKFFDTSTRQISQITIEDDGTFTFKSNSYTQEAQSDTLVYLMLTTSFESAIKTKSKKVTRNGDVVGFFYSETPLPFCFYGGTRTGLVCNGKDLFSTGGSSNSNINTSKQETFGLVGCFDVKNHTSILYEDGFGNFAVFETPITVFEENTGFVHVFKVKEA